MNTMPGWCGILFPDALSVVVVIRVMARLASVKAASAKF
jgi:hypothetical protein